MFLKREKQEGFTTNEVLYEIEKIIKHRLKTLNIRQITQFFKNAIFLVIINSYSFFLLIF